MYIKSVHIKNFRNFSDFRVDLWKSVVVVGENNAGKSNFLYALRLVLDPSLPNSARNLEATDFWEGLPKPFGGAEIRVTVTFADFAGNGTTHAAVPKCFSEDGTTSSISYVYGPKLSLDNTDQSELNEDQYEWYFWCEAGNTQISDASFQKFIPLEVLPALRNVSSELENNYKSPLHRLIRRLKVDETALADLSKQIDTQLKALLALPPIPTFQTSIIDRFVQMVGSVESVNPTLGLLPSNPNGLLRYIRLFSDDKLSRYVSEIGTGYANIVYIILLLLDLKQREKSTPQEERRATTILAVEEPEAHLHPHLQRLVYGDLFREAEDNIPLFLTTHSPNIVSVSPLKSLLLLKRTSKGTQGTNILNAGMTDREIEDIERYLDVTRSELVFSSGVILVEGIAEVYIVREFAKLWNPKKPLDVLGISVINIHGIDFAPYLKLLGYKGLDIRTAVITDGDPDKKGMRTGIKRCKSLLTHITSEVLGGHDDDNELANHGLFVGSHTLEIDLIDIGYRLEVLDVFRELGERSTSIKKTKAVLDKWDTSFRMDKRKLVGKIERVCGKGRFAQRLAPKLDITRIPPYIEKAFEYMKMERDV